MNRRDILLSWAAGVVGALLNPRRALVDAARTNANQATMAGEDLASWNPRGRWAGDAPRPRLMTGQMAICTPYRRVVIWVDGEPIESILIQDAVRS